MKLSLFTFVATLTMAYAKERDLQIGVDLQARWEMSEPTIAYDAGNGVFTFKFLTASQQNTDDGLKTSFWDSNCQDTQNGQTPFPIGSPEIDDPLSPGSVPGLKMTVQDDTTEKPEMKFTVDPAAMIDKNFQAPEPNPRPLYKSEAGTGTVVFCVRNGIGYKQDGAYQEVNYIESLVSITYDLTSNFKVEDFEVAPKDRQETTQSVDYSAALEAYICVGPSTPGYSVGSDSTYKKYNEQDFQVPNKVTDYATGTGSKQFNQGSLINICITVKDSYATQGVRIAEIVDFTFTRVVADSSDITQQAIFEKAASSNYLTSFTQANCADQVSCDFASVLFADFYATAGTVKGSGNGNLKFYNQRRLTESGKNGLRRLEEDAGPGSSAVDISVPVDGNTEGPGDLKTAGSASIGATAFATVVALVGAIVMA